MHFLKKSKKRSGNKMIERTLQNLPDQPGIYKFYDENKHLLYVGKAKSLKNRVKSYFKFTPTLGPANKISPRIVKMLSEAISLEFIITSSEYDALILENSLIKELKPKYNILLRDDKTFPYIKVDFSEDFPRFEITRKVVKTKGIRYVGPFASSAHDILKALYTCFKLVQKKNCLKEKKTCLFYQIDRCLGPCEGKVDKDRYSLIAQEAFQALLDRKVLIKALEEKMHEASMALNFEEAANLRDMQESIKNTLHVINLDLAKIEDFDVVAIHVAGNIASIMRFFIRRGKVVSNIHKIVKNSHGYDLDELYKRSFMQFYKDQNILLTNKILTAHDFESKSEIENYFLERFDKKVSIKTPRKGEKYRLIQTALENAKEKLSSYTNKSQEGLYEEIQELFDLRNIPFRIEVFDNSHISGDSPVGSMITYEEKFQKESYRIFNLSSHDEYGQMRELLTRRIKNFKEESPPDLWVLDGGKTLLKLAQSLLKEYGYDLDTIAIAKEKRDAKAYRAKSGASDIIYTLNYDFKLPVSDRRLQFIQKLRDEAHRFAVKSHRRKKQTKDMKVALLTVDGIGEATLKKLLAYFGDFEHLYQAEKSELEEIIGAKRAKNLIYFLKE